MSSQVSPLEQVYTGLWTDWASESAGGLMLTVTSARGAVSQHIHFATIAHCFIVSHRIPGSLRSSCCRPLLGYLLLGLVPSSSEKRCPGWLVPPTTGPAAKQPVRLSSLVTIHSIRMGLAGQSSTSSPAIATHSPRGHRSFSCVYSCRYICLARHQRPFSCTNHRSCLWLLQGAKDLRSARNDSKSAAALRGCCRVED
jgi:hypothetical protein